MSAPAQIQQFTDLGLPAQLMEAVTAVGYETPSPIQAACIPALLAGRDLIGQAQTGTGKTAAFALPLLARIDLNIKAPQMLVLAPTRELAIQVAEACKTYARFLPDFHVLPIYGGQAYGNQLHQLKRGVHVVVGTPGRIMDHMRRGSLQLDQLRALVLDEADEMLRMGFIDDVEWILEHTPDARQIALFSATMPDVIRRVAARHLNEPQLVRIESKTTTAATIHQRYWSASGMHKLDALTRVLETETFDGVIVFVRTKTATAELAERLEARGFAAEALNGDVPQAQREKTVERLKDGRLDILIATDVAARGLDVQRISHVINYDIPYDTESYVHRIGRTGRAGRPGEAILFVAPREHRMLRAIEKATGQRIEPMAMPSAKDVNTQRVARFKQRILEAMENEPDPVFYQLASEIEQETDGDPLVIAAVLASMLQGTEPLLMDEKASAHAPARERRERNDDDRPRRQAEDRPRREREFAPKTLDPHPRPLKDYPEVAMERYRLAVGYQHGVKPGNIVGAIANEADIESCYIGHIEIYDDFTTIDLPAGMPPETFRDLQNTRVCQQRLAIRSLNAADDGAAASGASGPAAPPVAPPDARHDPHQRMSRPERPQGQERPQYAKRGGNDERSGGYRPPHAATGRPQDGYAGTREHPAKRERAGIDSRAGAPERPRYPAGNAAGDSRQPAAGERSGGYPKRPGADKPGFKGKTAAGDKPGFKGKVGGPQEAGRSSLKLRKPRPPRG